MRFGRVVMCFYATCFRQIPRFSHPRSVFETEIRFYMCTSWPVWWEDPYQVKVKSACESKPRPPRGIRSRPPQGIRSKPREGPPQASIIQAPTTNNNNSSRTPLSIPRFQTLHTQHISPFPCPGTLSAALLAASALLFVGTFKLEDPRVSRAYAHHNIHSPRNRALAHIQGPHIELTCH